MPNQHQVYVSKAYDHEQTITLLLDKLEELDHVELVGRGSAIPNVIRVAEQLVHKGKASYSRFTTGEEEAQNGSLTVDVHVKLEKAIRKEKKQHKQK